MSDTKKFMWWARHGWYKLYEDGRIEKPDGYLSDGKSWEWVGLVEKKPYGKLGQIIPRDKCFDIKELKYKNGNYRYCVVDLDHGTTRIWQQ